MAIIKAIDKKLASFSKLLCLLGAGIIFFQMGIILVDVILRTFFHSTVVGASIMARNSLIASVFLGMPYVTFLGGHTRAEVFYTNGSPRRKFCMDVFAHFVGIIIFALMSCALINPTLQAFKTGQFDSEGAFLLPMSPFYVCALFGAVFSFYAAVRCFITTIAAGLSAYKEVN